MAVMMVCCELHVPAVMGSCCDPDDCGPCCPTCPTCPVHARSIDQGPEILPGGVTLPPRVREGALRVHDLHTLVQEFVEVAASIVAGGGADDDDVRVLRDALERAGDLGYRPKRSGDAWIDRQPS